MTAAAAVAAVAPIAEAMLPREAPQLEKALLAAELARIATVDPRVITSIWHPWRCPKELLPYLASAVSVDVWDNQWSEIEKRREIALSPRLHRLKGTLWAVKAAALRLGVPVEITEWWEVSPTARRGTFRIFADVTGVEDTPALRAKLVERVDLSKPKSRVVEARLGIAETGPLGIAAATWTSSTIIADPFALGGPVEATGPLGIASSTWTSSTLIAEPRPNA